MCREQIILLLTTQSKIHRKEKKLLVNKKKTFETQLVGVKMLLITGKY